MKAVKVINGLAGVCFLICMPVGATGQPLAPFTSVDVSSGFGVASSSVNIGHEIFQFETSGVDAVTISVLVTEIFPGTEFTDDDTELFLFDASGHLLAENDDPPPEDSFFQSLIGDFQLPHDGEFFVAVTTFDNNPLFNVDNEIVGWEDDGGSSVAFDLEIIDTSVFVPEPTGGSMLLFALAIAPWTRRSRDAAVVRVCQKKPWKSG